MNSTSDPEPTPEFPRDRGPGLPARVGGFLRRHWRWIVPGTATMIAGVAWLAFGYFGIHTLWIDDRVDEEGPVFASGAVADATTDEPGGADGSPDAPAAGEDGDGDAADGTPATDATTGGSSDAGSDDADPADGTSPAANPADGDEGDPGEPGSADDGAGTETDADTREGETPTATPSPTPTPTPEPTPEPTPQVVTLVEGTFSGLGRYSAEGRALVLNDGSEQRFLRFEDFVADNGPDLNVYLSAAPADGPSGALDDDFIDLGDLKGNIGSQNYEIPPEVDLERYSTVVIWCVRFSAGFGVAALGPPAA